jgi:hypothetical protein
VTVKRKIKQTLPEQGAAFAVRLDDGRFGVCRVLRQAHGNDVRTLGEPSVLVACSSWIGEAIPDPAEPALRKILLQTHHLWNGQPEVFWANDPPPGNFQRIGTIPPTPEERKTKCDTLAGWEVCQMSPLFQWRWDHDREAVLAEDAREEEIEEQENRKRIEAATKDLKSLTLETLSAHRFFKNWKDYPPKEAIKASRALMKRTLKALAALGPKSKKDARRAVLQECIEGFNSLDATMGHFIETMERDDICSEFDLLVNACGLGDCENLADEWRDW